MAKLPKLQSNTDAALLNTSKNVLADLIAINDINTIPELEDIFPKKESTVAKIRRSMEADGFHKEEPIVMAKLEDGTVLGVADGHTRLMVAKEIGLDEVPVIYKVFGSLEDAQRYAKDRQLNRRNLNDAEILSYADDMELVEGRPGEGRASEKLADELGVSASTIEHARTVSKRADDETKEKIKKGEISLAAAYKSVKKPSKKKKKEEEEEDDDLSDALSEGGKGQPQGLNFSHSDGLEHGPDERFAGVLDMDNEADARVAENRRIFLNGKKEGFEAAVGAAANAIYDKLVDMNEQGMSLAEAIDSDLFADLSATIMMEKLSIACAE